uniref:ElyC/SanA/YdcF family protein n=1 Tax=Fulvivirga sp. TaxID=1931237 RepID=UPI00404A7561
MNRLYKILQIVLVIAMLMALLFFDRVGAVIKTLNSGDGILLGIFRFIGSYFENADAWNIIILLVTFSFVIILFALLSIGYEKLFGFLSVKYKVLSFTQREWFSWVRTSISGLTILLLLILVSNVLVISNGARATYSSINDIEEAKPVIVLGTGKYLRDGVNENLYYTYRIDAALELWKAGKAQYFIISGDKTDSTGYDETRDMELDLIAGGVPADAIKKDGAGYRTLDSILRIRALFKVDDVIIVSQEFHTERALFLAWFYGVDAMAYNAKGSSTASMVQRETFGKVKMLLDLYAFNMQPKVSKHDDYREKFEVKSDLHVVLLILVIITVGMSLWMLVNIMEKNTKGIYKKLVWSLGGLTGTILITVSLYETTDILDDVAVFVADKTGIAKEAVENKEKRKQETAKLIEEIQVETKKLEVKYDSIFKASVEELKNPKPAVDSVLLAKESLNISTDNSEKNEEVFASLIADNKNEVVESAELSKEEVEKRKEDDLFGGLSLTEGDETDVPLSKTIELSEFKAKVHGTQTVKHNSEISFRLNEDLNVNGKKLPKNSVLKGRINLIDDKLIINFNIAGKDGSAYDEFDDLGLDINRFDKYSADEYIVSDGLVFKGRI